MTLINTKLRFAGSGKISATVDTILFEDSYIADTLALAEAGHAGLDVRFVNSSVLGALNELMDGLTTTSGSVVGSVQCYREGVDSSLFVHTLSHGLGTFDVNVTMYDANPASGPVAQNVMTCWTPVDANTVRIELDSAASGYFVVLGCP
jgi:hypothetical protein